MQEVEVEVELMSSRGLAYVVTQEPRSKGGNDPRSGR